MTPQEEREQAGRSERGSRLIVQLVKIHKSFNGKPVLAGMSLNIRHGESMAIIGRSGSGKSVTLKHMVGLMLPDEGQVRVDGQTLSELDRNGLMKTREKFGYLFQGAALLNSLTVYENLALPLREHTDWEEEKIRETVAEKLEWVELKGKEDAMPADLSGGMKKRVGLARAIIRNPEIVLYDEPTSGLDPVMANTINRLIDRVHEKTGATSVVVTHDMDSAFQIADRVAMLYQGKIIHVGTVEETKHSDNEIVSQFIRGVAEGVFEREENEPEWWWRK